VTDQALKRSGSANANSTIANPAIKPPRRRGRITFQISQLSFNAWIRSPGVIFMNMLSPPIQENARVDLVKEDLRSAVLTPAAMGVRPLEILLLLDCRNPCGPPSAS
jgi:hypothetical protein